MPKGFCDAGIFDFNKNRTADSYVRNGDIPIWPRYKTFTKVAPQKCLALKVGACEGGSSKAARRLYWRNIFGPCYAECRLGGGKSAKDASDKGV